jgi:hypothetical protein
MTRSRISISTSPHGSPGKIVAVENRKVVWAGPIEGIAEAWPFDMICCHEDDEEQLDRLLRGDGNPESWIE